jgi:hypothetical protein
MLFALFCGCVGWKTAFKGCLGRFEAGVRLHIGIDDDYCGIII